MCVRACGCAYVRVCVRAFERRNAEYFERERVVMPPQCCRCKGKGRCRSCACARSGKPCTNCTPSHVSRCENHEDAGAQADTAAPANDTSETPSPDNRIPVLEPLNLLRGTDTHGSLLLPQTQPHQDPHPVTVNGTASNASEEPHLYGTPYGTKIDLL